MDRQITAMTSRKTRMKLIESLGRDLSALDAEHLRRHRRIADSACSTRMSVDGRRIVGFASNDYLGLAAHPALIQALGDGARRYGAGSGGSHLLGGHSRAHAQAEQDLAAFCGGFVDDARALYRGYDRSPSWQSLSRHGACWCDGTSEAGVGDAGPSGGAGEAGHAADATIRRQCRRHASPWRRREPSAQ
jgi:hypothetical protein